MNYTKHAILTLGVPGYKFFILYIVPWRSLTYRVNHKVRIRYVIIVLIENLNTTKGEEILALCLPFPSQMGFHLSKSYGDKFLFSTPSTVGFGSGIESLPVILGGTLS
jgi:hypothetical protein